MGIGAFTGGREQYPGESARIENALTAQGNPVLLTVEDRLNLQLDHLQKQQAKVERMLQLLRENPGYSELLNLSREVL